MKKKYSLSLLLFCCLQFTTYTNLYAGSKPVVKASGTVKIVSPSEEILQPFGDVKWNDNIYDVLKKICAMDSVEKIGFAPNINTSENSIYPRKEVFDKKELCSNSEFANSGFNIIESAYSMKYITTPSSDVFNEHRRKDAYLMFMQRHFGNRLIVLNDKKYDFFSFDVAISAEPIIINDIKFSAGYTFASNANMGAGMIEDNSKPLSFNFEGDTYYTYNYLSNVQLKTLQDQGQLIRMNTPEIKKTIQKKYENMYRFSQYSEGYVSVSGKNDNSLMLYDTNGDMYINYVPPKNLLDKFNGKYDELLKRLIKKSTTNMTNSL